MNLPGELLHPLGYCPYHGLALQQCRSYNLWSGIAGSFLTSLPGWTVALTVYWRHHNCRHRWCPLLGHPHPQHGQPVCPAHYHHHVVPERDPERSRRA